MYKLDSDPGDRRDSAQGSTPFLPRNPNHNRERRVMSPPRVPHPESPRHSKAIPPSRSQQHQSPHHIPHSNSRHASPHHSIQSSTHNGSPHRSNSSHRDMSSSEHSNSSYRELPPQHHSGSSHSSRHSSLTRHAEDNYSQHDQLLQSPRHSIQVCIQNYAEEFYQNASQNLIGITAGYWQLQGRNPKFFTILIGSLLLLSNCSLQVQKALKVLHNLHRMRYLLLSEA